MKKDFLLEIGCENLPSGYLDGALEQLESLFRAGLEAARIPFDTLEVLGTPRRLAVLVRGLATKQESREARIVGPPVSVGIGPDGGYTKAAGGFAKSQGVSLKRLSVVETEKGSYLAVVRRISGVTSASLLRELIPRWIREVKFPKTMRWSSGGFRFARPIRWMVTFLGDRVLRITVGNVTAANRTRLSAYYEDAVALENIGHYFEVIRSSGIILDPRARRETVRRMAREAAADLGGRLVEDEQLVGSVANLLESPVVLTGSFSRSFLSLPREVIVTALKSHQRYFSVEGRGGKLRPSFIAFADGARRNKKEISRGYERVLQARLADAQFYYREDTARPLMEMSEKLSGIIWFEGLGTVGQKTDRIERLALWLSSHWDIAGGRADEQLRRAARLAKADLASEMVKDGKEFTLLQGYIGREYARASKESEEVAEAIYEHYLPRFSGDRLPAGALGTLLAVADRLDTITGGFLLGFEPTGSQDPYALRRQALGLLRIYIEQAIPVSLSAFIEQSIACYGEEGFSSSERTPDDLAFMIRTFFTQRLNMMLRSKGFDYDLVGAVLAAPWDNPSTACVMVEELQGMRDGEQLVPFVLAMKRIINILPKDRGGVVTRESALRSLQAFADRQWTGLEFSPELFTDRAEDELFETAVEVFGALRRRSGKGAEGTFEILANLTPAVNRYFDEVLVNCEDERLRNNRISFLTETYRAFSVACDFSLIAGGQTG